MSLISASHFLADDGNRFRIGRITIVFKLSAADTAGSYTLCEAIEPPDSGAGRHRHGYDETFRVLEGRYTFELGEHGEQQRVLSAGETLFVPRGTAHAYRSLGPQTGRQLFISSPGGIFDAFIAAVAHAMVDTGAPTSARPAADFRDIAARHGIEFLP